MQLEDAAKLIPEESANGVYVITSSEELDAFLKLYPSKVVRSLCLSSAVEGQQGTLAPFGLRPHSTACHFTAVHTFGWCGHASTVPDNAFVDVTLLMQRRHRSLNKLCDSGESAGNFLLQTGRVCR